MKKLVILLSMVMILVTGCSVTKLDKISFDLHKDDMPPITTEYEDKFSSKDMPIYYVECGKK